MNEKKTISINPDLFKINGGNNTTRRQKKEHTIHNKIKVRETNEKKPKKISTIKRNILKMIRNQQIEKKKIDVTQDSSLKVNELNTKRDYQNDFNDTLEYLSTLTKDTEDKVKNHTIRRYPMSFTDVMDKKDEIEIPILDDMLEKEPITINSTRILPPPKYGCLKNGF